MKDVTGSQKICAFRGAIFDFIKAPGSDANPTEAYRYFPDGLLLVAGGKIIACGPYDELASQLTPEIQLITYQDKLIMPGFIDAHIHYPQTEMVASYGEQLLEWLNLYTFPTENQFGDKEYARKISKIFLQQLLSNGTTTAAVFGTVHPESVDALFEEALKINMRLIAGKVLMDRNGPGYLMDTAASGYADSEKLIHKWHERGRLLYAITPRFAATSSEEQLSAASQLKKEYPSVYIQTHLSENKAEVEWIRALFPDRKNYLDVYDHYGLTSSRSIFAHGIHLSADECKVLHQTGSAVAFCPTSNLFLGSGLFRLDQLKQHQVKVCMGTDIGAGTSFSMFTTLSEAYKVMQLQEQKFSPFQGFYLATLGGAKALSLAEKIGNFEPGKEADFVVIDPKATPLQKLRLQKSRDLADMLFVLMMLGDDRNIFATYVDGEAAYQQSL